MRYAALIPNMGPNATREGILGFARKAEALGYDALFASDHVVIPYDIQSVYLGTPDGSFPLPKETPVIEPLIAMAMAGAVTERIQIGAAVLVLPHRNPVLTAKMLASIDAMTAGRVILGAGVGWMSEEITLLGQPFAKRGAWCTEAIDLMRTLWRDERASFEGEFFDIPAVGFAPKPVHRDIPILIGGTSPAALRRVAAQGDGWLPSNLTIDALDDGMYSLREACVASDRRFEDLTICVRARVAFEPVGGPLKIMLEGEAPKLIDDVARLAAMGVNMILFEPVLRDPGQWVEAHERLMNEVIAPGRVR